MYAKREEIVIFGGSFNPPGIHHEDIAEAIAFEKWVDRLFIYPCGNRPDKETANMIAPLHRGEMSRLAFLPMEKTSVVLFDIQNNVFTRTHEIQKKYQELGRVWHVVGADLIKGGKKKQSFIHSTWKNGFFVWNNLNFLVVQRHGYPLNKEDLPPNSKILQVKTKGSSTEIRKKILRGESITELVSPKVEDYIYKDNLYMEAFNEKIDEREWLREDEGYWFEF